MQIYLVVVVIGIQIAGAHCVSRRIQCEKYLRQSIVLKLINRPHPALVITDRLASSKLPGLAGRPNGLIGLTPVASNCSAVVFSRIRTGCIYSLILGSFCEIGRKTTLK